MAMLNLVPPLFASGGVFNVQYMGYDEYCVYRMIDGLYFDNAYYILFYTFLSFLGISIPFVFDLPKYLTAISHCLGGWFISGLCFELMNLKTPDIVLNADSSPEIFTKFALCFIVAIALIMINFTWKKNN